MNDLKLGLSIILFKIRPNGKRISKMPLIIVQRKATAGSFIHQLFSHWSESSLRGTDSLARLG